MIDLIAVATGDQQRGIGGVMIEAACAALPVSAARSLEVGTQAANIPSVRLYERSVSAWFAPSFVLHRHVL